MASIVAKDADTDAVRVAKITAEAHVKAAQIAADARVEVARIQNKEHTKRFRSAIKAGLPVSRDDVLLPRMPRDDDEDGDEYYEDAGGDVNPLETALPEVLSRVCEIGVDLRAPSGELYFRVRKELPNLNFNRKNLSAAMKTLGYCKRAGRVGRKTVQCYHGIMLKEEADEGREQPPLLLEA